MFVCEPLQLAQRLAFCATLFLRADKPRVALQEWQPSSGAIVWLNNNNLSGEHKEATAQHLCMSEPRHAVHSLSLGWPADLLCCPCGLRCLTVKVRVETLLRPFGSRCWALAVVCSSFQRPPPTSSLPAGPLPQTWATSGSQPLYVYIKPGNQGLCGPVSGSMGAA